MPAAKLRQFSGRILRAAGLLPPSPPAAAYLVMRLEIQNEITRVPLPAGCSSRRGGSAEELAGLLSHSGEFSNVTAAELKSSALTSIIENGDVRVVANRELVAAAAICRLSLDEPRATLMNVMVRDDHRGKGLGKYIVTEALHAAYSAGYRSVVLRTDSHRDRALALYSALGFEADTTDPNSAALWERMPRESRPRRLS